MNAADEIAEVAAEKATETDIFLKEWGKETVRRNIPFLNEVLRSLLTLSVALCGGSLVLGPTISIGWRVVAGSAFLIAAIVALVVVMPYKGAASFLVPADVLSHKQKAISFK